jgi:drug/metabolite transporter (DMT)-like permease
MRKEGAIVDRGKWNSLAVVQLELVSIAVIGAILAAGYNSRSAHLWAVAVLILAGLVFAALASRRLRRLTRGAEPKDARSVSRVSIVMITIAAAIAVLAFLILAHR